MAETCSATPTRWRGAGLGQRARLRRRRASSAARRERSAAALAPRCASSRTILARTLGANPTPGLDAACAARARDEQAKAAHAALPWAERGSGADGRGARRQADGRASAGRRRAGAGHTGVHSGVLSKMDDQRKAVEQLMTKGDKGRGGGGPSGCAPRPARVTTRVTTRVTAHVTAHAVR